MGYTIIQLRRKLLPGKFLTAHNPSYAYSSRKIYRDGVKSGKLVLRNYCEVCEVKGGRPRLVNGAGYTRIVIVGHHYDYKKPLDVVFLCGACHFDVHRSETSYLAKFSLKHL